MQIDLEMVHKIDFTKDHSFPTVNNEKKVLEKKTKLVLLEFFSLIPDEEQFYEIEATSSPFKGADSANSKKTCGKADSSNNKEAVGKEGIQEVSVKRKSCHSDSSLVVNEGSKPKTGTVKYHTVAIGEADHKNLMDQIAVHMKTESGKLVVRSKSYETKAYYMCMRKKMQEMLLPIRDCMNENIDEGLKNLNQELKNETGFEKNRFRIFPSTLRSSKCECRRKRSRSHLRLNIPKIHEDQHGEPILTANTYAVNRLEEISNEIMLTYPNLLSGPITELLTPLQDNKGIPYALFAKAARGILLLQLQGLVTDIWHKVSLVMSLAKQTMVIGNLDDEMMEIMVDHSTKFFMENVLDSIEEEGGWDVLDASEVEEVLEETVPTCSCEDDSQNQMIKTLYDWIPFAISVLAVGIGLAYSLRLR